MLNADLAQIITNILGCCQKVQYGRVEVDLTLHEGNIKNYELVYRERYNVEVKK
jgi:hypothetical protein